MSDDTTGQEEQGMDSPSSSAEDNTTNESSSDMNDSTLTENAVPEENTTTSPAVDDVVENEADEAVAKAEVDAPPAPAPKPPARFKRGELVDGKITKTSPTEIIVDLGEGDEGVIPGRELENMGRQALEDLTEGTELPVFIVNPNDHRGRIVLSINRAIEELNWQEAELHQKNKDIYEGNIAGYNKGGLIVRFGRLRGFVPHSQISDERRRGMQGNTPEDMYSKMVNGNIFVKVIEVDRGRNRLILSERAASRETRENRKDSLIKELEVGQVIIGRVVSIEDFGVFVDVGGAEGLVHLTEITWRHITHPREVLKVGEEAKVEVISIDRNRKRIGLSIKRQAADPWDEVATSYDQGELVRAIVTKLTKFGAFARLVDAPDIEGLIHISELSEQRVSHPREVVNEKEELTLRVVKIDVLNRRLGLSLKQVNSAEYLDRDMEFFEQQMNNESNPEEEAPEVVETDAPEADNNEEAPAEE